MSIPLTYASSGQSLIAAVPELTEPYEALLREWEPDVPGPHIVYGDLLNPYLLELLSARAPDRTREERLRRIFAFLERLAQHEDVLVQELVYATVAERLGADPALLTIARRYMGEATRRLSDEVERFWNGGSLPSQDESATVAAARGDRKHLP